MIQYLLIGAANSSLRFSVLFLAVCLNILTCGRRNVMGAAEPQALATHMVAATSLTKTVGLCTMQPIVPFI